MKTIRVIKVEQEDIEYFEACMARQKTDAAKEKYREIIVTMKDSLYIYILNRKQFWA